MARTPDDRRADDDDTQNRDTRRLACGPAGTAGGREGIYPPTRCTDAPPNGDAVGARGKILPIRGAERRCYARRSLRWAFPAYRLSLHVRPRLGTGVQVML